MRSPELSNCRQKYQHGFNCTTKARTSLRIIAFEQAVSAYRWNSADPNVLLHRLVVLLLSLSNQGPLGMIESLDVLGLISVCWKFRSVSYRLVLVVVILH